MEPTILCCLAVFIVILLPGLIFVTNFVWCGILFSAEYAQPRLVDRRVYHCYNVFFELSFISTLCLKKNEPTLASCSFDKHGLILIILSNRHQYTFKNCMHIQLFFSRHFC